jgi:hypothetical protein
MNVPEKYSIVGYWHPRVVTWGAPWREVTKYVFLELASASVQSYWVKPLRPMSGSGCRRVRRRLKVNDSELLTEDEYTKRYNAEVLRLEQEKTWKVLSKK